MSRICHMCPGDIDSFAHRIRKAGLSLCAAAVARLDEAEGRVRAQWAQLSAVVAEKLRDCGSEIEKAREMWSRKYDHIRSLPIPAEIEEVHQKTVQSRDASGRTVTRVVEERVKVHNPVYDRQQKCLEDLYPLGQDLDGLLARCRERAEELARMEKNLGEFFRQVQEMRKALEEIRRSTGEHFGELAEQAELAKHSLEDAMAVQRPLPAMKKRDGRVDIDGVRRYTEQVRAAVDACQAALGRLRRVSEDLSADWNDAVYRHFDGVVREDVTEQMNAASNDLDFLAAALNAMCACLEAYYNAPIDIRRTDWKVSYWPVDLDSGATIGITDFHLHT